MQEIKINENDRGQRLDRFLKKFLKKASLSFIYKSIRKKNIVVNDKKAKNDQILEDGDSIKIYFSDETIEKFTRDDIKKKSNNFPDIIYEDENIIILNKPKGLLSHAASKDDYGNNLVDFLIGYLIEKKEFIPRIEKTFVPAIVNRLDRNTSGVVIGAKNAFSLRELNRIRENCIEKFYVTIVKGTIKKDFVIKEKLEKNKEKNISSISENGKDSITEVFVENTKNGFSLLKIKLLTGRTHQIRVHLSSKNLPIIGDEKYGKNDINKFFKEKFDLKGQFLHARSIRFKNIQGSLSYLNDKEFLAPLDENYKKIIDEIFNWYIFLGI